MNSKSTQNAEVRRALLNADALSVLEPVSKDESASENVRRRSRALLGRLVHSIERTHQALDDAVHTRPAPPYGEVGQTAGLHKRNASPKRPPTAKQGEGPFPPHELPNAHAIFHEFYQPLHGGSTAAPLSQPDEQLLLDFRDSMEDVAHNRNLFEAVIYRLGPTVFLAKRDMLKVSSRFCGVDQIAKSF